MILLFENLFVRMKCNFNDFFYFNNAIFRMIVMTVFEIDLERVQLQGRIINL